MNVKAALHPAQCVAGAAIGGVLRPAGRSEAERETKRTEDDSDAPEAVLSVNQSARQSTDRFIFSDNIWLTAGGIDVNSID